VLASLRTRLDDGFGPVDFSLDKKD